MAEQNGMIQIPPIALNIDIENIDEILKKLERVNLLVSEIKNIEPIDDYCLKISEVASILGINQNAVKKLVNAGQLKALKIGCTKVRKKELDRFMVYAEESGLTLEDLN
jgi:predicted DNA-binding protein (UPF0251 family)